MFAAPLWGMLEGQVIKDQYHLQQVLGAGTFGGVFRTDLVVRDTVLRTLATKIIFINQPELVSYQLQELQIALSLDHPHLLRCYDAGEATITALSISCLYLLMELAEETLKNRLNRGGISKEEVKVIVKNIAEGLAYLHEKEQVHLDLKPANILKVNGHWKIGDYGLVRSLNSTRSYAETVHLLGTPLFSPPESYQGVLSPAWDMWSLGIITVMLLTGQYPIQFQTQEELGEKIKNSQFDNLNWDDLEQPWQEIVEGCLQVDRQQRWTAQQVLSELNSENPPVLTIMLPGGVELEMIKIPAGSFLMGSAKNDAWAWDNEKPQHRVNLQEYYLGKYPVTQEQYQAVMGNNPSYFKGKDYDNNYNNAVPLPPIQMINIKWDDWQHQQDDWKHKKDDWEHHWSHEKTFFPKNPIETLSWNDAKVFCQKVYEITGQKVRLPTEAEWEYGCRSGTQSRYCFGDDHNQLGDYAWYSKNSDWQTHPVGQKNPNAWGLYDMHGNVWEWCEKSYYNEHYYVLRGGSCTEGTCSSADRITNEWGNYRHSSGFRLALSIP